MTQEEIKKQNKTRQYLTLTDCFTHLTRHHHHHCPGHSDVKSLPETDREKFRHRNTPHDPKPCCAVGATWLSVKPTMSKLIFFQQPWLLWQDMHLPNFCGKYSYTVSLQYKTQTWLANRMREWELSYIQRILFLSLFFIMKCFTPIQEIHHWEKIVPTYITAKPGFGVGHLRKLCLQNTGFVLAWPHRESGSKDFSKHGYTYMVLWHENLFSL